MRSTAAPISARSARSTSPCAATATAASATRSRPTSTSRGSKSPFHAVFIRAPVVERAGDAVEVDATVDGHPVLAGKGAITVAAFHPELSGDSRIHERFLQEV